MLWFLLIKKYSLLYALNEHRCRKVAPSLLHGNFYGVITLLLTTWLTTTRLCGYSSSSKHVIWLGVQNAPMGICNFNFFQGLHTQTTSEGEGTMAYAPGSQISFILIRLSLHDVSVANGNMHYSSRLDHQFQECSRWQQNGEKYQLSQFSDELKPKQACIAYSLSLLIIRYKPCRVVFVSLRSGYGQSFNRSFLCSILSYYLYLNTKFV